MTSITPIIRLLTSQEAQDSGIRIQALILEHNGNNYHLHGGSKDIIHVFTAGVCIYVLTINTSVGYMGLNTYMSSEPDPINSVFLHSVGDIRETLGANWQRMSPRTITTKLINYLI